MADTFTSLLRLVLQETGGNQNVWGDINNASAIDLLEDAIAARFALDVTPATNPVTLLSQNGDVDQSRNAIIALTGAPGEDKEIIVPSTSKLYIISNETAFVMTIKTVANAGTPVRAGTRVAVVVDPVADDVFEIGFIPTASETEAGIIQIATQVEMDAGVDDTKAITPAKYEGRASSEVLSGHIRRATAAEAEADTAIEDTAALTVVKLVGRTATEDRLGVIELATQAEVDAGTDTERAITPATLAALPSPVGILNGCKAFKTAALCWPRNDLPDIGQSPPPGPGDGSGSGNAVGEVAVDFNAEVFDTDNYHDISVNNTRFTIPSTGVSAVEFIIGYRMDDEVSNAQSGLGHIRLRKNGVVNGAVDSIFVVTHNRSDPGWIPWDSTASGGGTQQSGAASGQAGSQAWSSGTIFVDGDDFIEIMVLAQAGFRDIPPNGIWAEMRVLG